MDYEYAPYMLSQTGPDDTAAWYGMGNYNNPVTSAESGVGLPGEEAAETEKSVRADQDVYGPAAGGTGTTGTGGVTTTANQTNPLAGIWNTLKPLIVGADGKANPMGALGIAALMSTLGLGKSEPRPTGYQGGIPRYTAVRQQVPIPADSDRRPGGAGRKYFTDVQYVPKAAQGGLMSFAQGRYLNGSTDGMADKIPANIDGKQEARLSHGEFVIPADVVSHLGNGNSEAGAQELYSMMDRIRKARTGNPKQGKQIAPSKYLPS